MNQNQVEPKKTKVVQMVFDHETQMNVLTSIKHWGIDRTKMALLAEGMHPTSVKVLIKKVIGTYGW